MTPLLSFLFAMAATEWITAGVPGGNPWAEIAITVALWLIVWGVADWVVDG